MWQKIILVFFIYARNTHMHMPTYSLIYKNYLLGHCSMIGTQTVINVAYIL